MTNKYNFKNSSLSSFQLFSFFWSREIQKIKPLVGLICGMAMKKKRIFLHILHRWRDNEASKQAHHPQCPSLKKSKETDTRQKQMMLFSQDDW